MPNLTSRQTLILRVIIQEYINSAESVSSKLIRDNYLDDVSSATIRNDMAALETLGYLKQPHTSAGRVPTDKGYRYFVSSLMGKAMLAESHKEKIKELVSSYHKEIDGLLMEASALLSSITKYTSVLLFPFSNQTRLKRINLISLSKFVVLIVAVDSNGNIWKQDVETHVSINRDNLNLLENFINERFSGKKMTEIPGEREWHKLVNDEIMAILIKHVLSNLVNIFSSQDSMKVFVQGASLFLEQPEFALVSKSKEVIECLDEKNRVLEFLNNLHDSGKVFIRIGPEVAKISEECSFVGANYCIDETRRGTVGLFGPCRMDYAMAVSAVEYLADNLSLNFRKIY